MSHRVDSPEAEFLVPNPLVSRGKPAFASSGDASAVNDAGSPVARTWCAESGAGARPWVALQVAPGPERVLVSWVSSQLDGGGAPAAYRLESSTDSTNGADGTWRHELTITGNTRHSRAHVIEFDGQRWVRLIVTAVAPPASGARIDELDVHDASDGCDDTWLFIGGGRHAGAFARNPRTQASSFAECIHARYPGYYPAVIDAGSAGEPLASTLDRVPALLEDYPDFRHVVIAPGSWGASRAANLEPAPPLDALVAMVVAAGRVPVLVPATCAGDLPEGAIAEAWADALDGAYVPQ